MKITFTRTKDYVKKQTLLDREDAPLQVTQEVDPTELSERAVDIWLIEVGPLACKSSGIKYKEGNYQEFCFDGETLTADDANALILSTYEKAKESHLDSLKDYARLVEERIEGGQLNGLRDYHISKRVSELDKSGLYPELVEQYHSTVARLKQEEQEQRLEAERLREVKRKEEAEELERSTNYFLEILHTYGTQSQKERYEAGCLPKAEFMALMQDHMIRVVGVSDMEFLTKDSDNLKNVDLSEAQLSEAQYDDYLKLRNICDDNDQLYFDLMTMDDDYFVRIDLLPLDSYIFKHFPHSSRHAIWYALGKEKAQS